MTLQHGGNVWLAAKKYGIKTQEILDFSANINPLGPSPRAMEALEEALQEIQHYPEPQAETLRRDLAGVLGLPEECLLLGNGAAELVYALARVLKPTRLLLPAPTFGEYAEGFADVEKVELPLDPAQNFALPDTSHEKLRAGDLLILCNPNNPTGQLLPEDQLRALLHRVGEVGALLLVDEAFMDFVLPPCSLLKNVPQHPHLLVLRSLTKFFALPGLRLGYLAASPSLVQQVQGVLPPWRVNRLAQVAGCASLQDQAYIEHTLQFMEQQKEWLYQELKNLPGLAPLPPAANFILVDCRGSHRKAQEIQDFLGPRGVLIRLCHNFSGLDDYYFRVAVRSPQENRRLLQNLQQLLQD